MFELCLIQNVVAFTASLQTDLKDSTHVKGVYCADLNNPWEYKYVLVQIEIFHKPTEIVKDFLI